MVGHKAGLRREDLEEKQPRQDVIPFESEHQYMATLHQGEQGQIIYVKGSAEAILSRCDQARNAQGESTDLNRGEIEQIAESFWEKGLRVLAFAQKSAGSDRLERCRMSSRA